MILNLHIIAIVAAIIGAIDLIVRRKSWFGPYGWMMETKAALKALLAASILIVLTTPAIFDSFPIAERVGTPISVVLLIAATYLSIISILRGRWLRIKGTEIALWCRELGLLLQQNVQLIKALDILAHDSRSNRLRQLSLFLREAIRRGEAISECMNMPPFYGYPGELLKAGEQAGNLSSALLDLADIFERRGNLGFPERRAPKYERPAPSTTTDVVEEVLLHVLEGNELHESLLSSRVPGIDNSDTAVQDSPVVRLVNIVLAYAIYEGANHIYFIEAGGTSVEYYLDNEEQRAIVKLPTAIRDVVIRRLKLMANIPYWHKPPATGFINIQYDGESHRLVLWVELEESGEEAMRLDILPSGEDFNYREH